MVCPRLGHGPEFTAAQRFTRQRRPGKRERCCSSAAFGIAISQRPSSASSHHLARCVDPQTHRRVAKPEWVKEDGAVRSSAERVIGVRMRVAGLERPGSALASQHGFLWKHAELCVHLGRGGVRGDDGVATRIVLPTPSAIPSASSDTTASRNAYRRRDSPRLVSDAHAIMPAMARDRFTNLAGSRLLGVAQ
jgi:hypothetical protein